MTLLTKREAEQLVKNVTGIVRVTAKDVQAVLAANKDAIILLLKK